MHMRNGQEVAASATNNHPLTTTLHIHPSRQPRASTRARHAQTKATCLCLLFCTRREKKNNVPAHVCLFVSQGTGAAGWTLKVKDPWDDVALHSSPVHCAHNSCAQHRCVHARTSLINARIPPARHIYLSKNNSSFHQAGRRKLTQILPPPLLSLSPPKRTLDTLYAAL